MKNLFRVRLLTVKSPHTHSTRYGIGSNKLVITVAPQKLICAQGRTYPRKEVAINNKKMMIPCTNVFIASVPYQTPLPIWTYDRRNTTLPPYECMYRIALPE